ncbi:MAG: methyltransferase domain-containing protein [Corynebacteriales bacterium]|nr:methyltransferase domain-containing protein [Mycobacteriales bacterium]
MPSPIEDEYATLDPLAVRIATHEKHSAQPDDVDAAVSAALNLAGTEHLLDVGCGTGKFLARLRNSRHHGTLIGVDISPAALRSIRALPNVCAVGATATALPFSNEAVDVVTARHMLYHVEQPVTALEEFRRVTKQNGTVALVINHPHVTPRIRELIETRATKYGIAAPTQLMYPIDSRNLPNLVNEVFGNYTIVRYDNALVFSSPQPLIAFAISLLGFSGVTLEHPARRAIMRDIAEHVRAWFATSSGPWRDEKGYVVITTTCR